MTQRFQKHPFLGLFDGPDANSSAESRRISTVPQQALFAMNNPWVDEQAHTLARRVIHDGGTEKERIRMLYEVSFGRLPTASELKKSHQWLARAADLAKAAGIPPERSDEESWTSITRAIVNANEFIYVD